MANDLNVAQLVALSKAVPSKAVTAAKKNLPQGGKSEVDFLVRVSGYVKKGEDYERPHAPDLPKMALLLKAWNKLAKHVQDALIRECAESLEKTGEVEVDEDLKARVETAWGDIVKTTTRTINGSVTAKLETTLVEEAK